MVYDQCRLQMDILAFGGYYQQGNNILSFTKQNSCVDKLDTNPYHAVPHLRNHLLRSLLDPTGPCSYHPARSLHPAYRDIHYLSHSYPLPAENQPRSACGPPTPVKLDELYEGRER